MECMVSGQEKTHLTLLLYSRTGTAYYCCCIPGTTAAVQVRDTALQ